ncbi:MAG: PDZ domain-containing protein [Cyanosarcina radialis HA8281-LM2]|jgi:carboxyl-terminal processing protease|nr:PDZ domain-containing protein [Cyanosarcina radialis HA8281-LM2]
MRKRFFSICCLVVLSVFLAFGWRTPSAAALTEDRRLFMEAWRIVNNSYLDDTFNHQNWWFIREKALKQNWQNREEAYEAIEKMLASLDDPFTRLLRPDRYRSLQVNTSGELSGVGLQIAFESETGNIQVIAPIADSPAAAAGLQPLDRILTIDGIPTNQLTLDLAAEKMRGPIGTTVTLTVQRPGEPTKEVELVRSRIALNPVRAELRALDNGTSIGYIQLSQFSANAPAEIDRAVKDLERQGAEAYILDLRNNPGGLLQAGVEIADRWLNEGTIVYTVNRQGTMGSFDAVDGWLTPDPLVVLVNHGTASASEILAGALQDSGRAVLVGEKTFGKGIIQSLFDLPDGSGLAVTVAKYETPNHRDIHKLGIVPDRLVPLEPTSLVEFATKSDRQYQAAVDLLSQPQAIATK